MRIAMLCSNHAVTDARITFKQAASLAGMGHQVCVFGLEGKFPVQLPGVEICVVYPFRVGIRGRVLAMPHLYRPVMRWKPDVVTCHEPESAALGLLIRARCGARVIFDVHELWQETMAARAPAAVRPAALAAFSSALRAIARRCDWVTVVSPWILEFYRAARGDGRVDIIYNSPPMAMFPPCHQDLEGPVVLAHEGSLGLNRGMIPMLEALALVRQRADVRLLIVGGVEEDERAAFDRKVAQLNLAGAIDAPGWVLYDKVGELLSCGQIGIVAMQPTPNNYGGLSNKIFNYMCCGMAAIVPAGSATADLVRGADCGLAVDTTRPAAMAEAITQLAQDRALRARLGANGRRAIETTFGWHKMADRLREIYAQVEKT
jgi:glycosyltransferase involved in cell wall biosynthesis